MAFFSSPSGTAWQGRAVYFLLATGLMGWVVVDALGLRMVSHGARSDIWEHVAALAAWSRDLAAPLHPHTGQPEPAVRFTPLYMIHAAMAAASGVSPLGAYFTAAVVHVVVFVAGLWWFCRVAFRTEWAAPLALLVFLTFWGEGWGWSNAYDLRAFLLVAGYPSTGVFGLSFILWAWCLRLLAREGRWSGVECGGVAVLTAGVLASHPPTAVFAVAGAGALAFLLPGVERRARLLMLALVSCGALLALLWPFYPVWGVVSGRELPLVANPVSKLIQGDIAPLERLSRPGRMVHFYGLSEIWKRAGVGLLGLPALIVVAFLPRYRWLALLGAVMVVPYLVNIWIALPLGHRFFFFLLAAGHLALVAVVVTTLRRWGGGGRVLAAAAVAGAVGWAAVAEVSFTLNYSRSLASRAVEGPGPTSPVVVRAQALAAAIPEGAMVLTDPTTAFSLSPFGPMVVRPLRGDHLLPDRLERRAAVTRFLAEGTDEADRRAILARFGVTHVIVSEQAASMDLRSFLDRAGHRIPVSTGDLIVALVPKKEPGS
jgi:hypothetical protein